MKRFIKLHLLILLLSFLPITSQIVSADCIPYVDPGCDGPPPPPPTSPCTIDDWEPAECGGPSFCALYVGHPSCITSLCTFYDWDPAFCGAATYCEAYPNTSPHCL